MYMVNDSVKDLGVSSFEKGKNSFEIMWWTDPVINIRVERVVLTLGQQFNSSND